MCNKKAIKKLDRSTIINNLLRDYYLELLELASSTPSFFTDVHAVDDPTGFARKQSAEYKEVLTSKTTPDLLSLYQEHLRDNA